MIHVVLSIIALILGALAAMSAASGFWTGVFVGAVMATSGLKWAKHAWGEALKAQAIKEAQLAAREAALQRAVQKMEADKAAHAAPGQQEQQVAPPPPPTTPKSAKSQPEVTPRPGPAPLPEEAFTPAMHWPPLVGNASFEMPPQ